MPLEPIKCDCTPLEIATHNNGSGHGADCPADPATIVLGDDRCFICGSLESEHDDAKCEAEYNDGADAFTQDEHRKFFAGYAEAADFVNNDNDDVEPLEGELEAVAKRECHEFLEDNKATIDLYTWNLERPLGSAGADFYFTRNGHGVGFWDRSYKTEHVPFLRALTDASHPYGMTEY